MAGTATASLLTTGAISWGFSPVPGSRVVLVITIMSLGVGTLAGWAIDEIGELGKDVGNWFQDEIGGWIELNLGW